MLHTHKLDLTSKQVSIRQNIYGKDLFYFGMPHKRKGKKRGLKKLATQLNIFKDLIGRKVVVLENLPRNGKRVAPTRQFNETKYVLAWARRNHIRVAGMEPDQTQLMKFALARHTKNKIALWIYLNQVYYNNYNPKFFKAVLKKMGFKSSQFDDLLHQFEVYAGKLADKNGLKSAISPYIKKYPSNAVSVTVNNARDRYMAMVIMTELKKGNNVFALAHTDHVLAQAVVFGKKN